MRRRKFITLLGGTLAAWPLAARAQRPMMPVIGFLSSGQPQVFAHMIDAFRQGLNETGYVVGQNVAFAHRAAGSDYDRFRVMADDLVRRQVAVIFATGGTAAALAARTATSTIPIVFYVGGDPVQQGLVASLGRPGGNLTGFGWLGVALAAKRLELLRELLPNGATIGMLVNPASPDTQQSSHTGNPVERADIVRSEIRGVSRISRHETGAVRQVQARDRGPLPP